MNPAEGFIGAGGEAARAEQAALIERIFAADGPLARALAGYARRPEQIEFAQRVSGAIAECTTLIAEAGTGTGKTIGYLVPALLFGGKVIVSTGTKTLQDQLSQRDLPAVRDALGVAASVAVLKGRANYVCHEHLERNLAEGRLTSRAAVAHLLKIERFARRSISGERGELSDVPEDSPAWALATSTRDNCLGQNCGHYRDCFVMRARREALAADVVIVNHHLFFADAILRDEGMAELLPAANTVILDEAHQLPDVATVFFGQSVSTGQVLDLVRDAIRDRLREARDAVDLEALIRQAERAARDLRLVFEAKEGRFAFGAAANASAHSAKASAHSANAAHNAQRFDADAFKAAAGALQARLFALAEGLARLAERGEGLASCAGRAQSLAQALQRWVLAEGDEHVRWIDVYAQSLALQLTPLSVAEPFRRQIEARPKAWILTSATLAAGSDFSLYQERMGLEEAATAQWASPFDYASNAMLYLPSGLPDPGDPAHTDCVVDAALPVIAASGGRAFMLFTSLRAMRRAHERVKAAFERSGGGWPLLVQGEAAKNELLNRFRALGNAVLLASASFWEGVDVRGDALSLVIIDKLPFAPPDDPVLAARLAAMQRAGRNAFLEYQVPQAAITLKQGAGRLIRDASDRGVLMICDPRLTSRPYGARMLQALPPMRRTSRLDEVCEFLARCSIP
jgi:ATP-dependent DNA helicase DinG